MMPDVLPLTAIARHLTSRGFSVTFVGAPHHADLISSSGASFFPVHESLTIEKGQYRQWGAARAAFPEGMARMAQDFKTFFIGQIPGQVESTRAGLKHVLKKVKAEGLGRKIVIINETMWFGFLPWKWGAELPSLDHSDNGEESPLLTPPSLGINVTPLMLDADHLPPFPTGLLPSSDDNHSARKRDRVLKDWLYRFVVREAYDGFRDLIRAAGGLNVPDEWMINLSVTAHNTTLQLCHPALEYPRPDLPPHVKFAGCVPPSGAVPKGFVFPLWWQADVVENVEKRRIVVVSQGTLARDYSMLLAPTVKALAGREDVLLIALLGKGGLEVPPGILPASEEQGDVGNVRVVDFIPYDAVLKYADVMVFNAGYGGFVHCVVNGVPVIAAGLTEDKCEVSARVEWTGVGINLRTGRPSAEAVASAVDEILTNPKYRARARELAAEVSKENALEVVEKEVRVLAGLC
jgi:Glycosyl transferases, related to UDP-glucuronosyltransferase